MRSRAPVVLLGLLAASGALVAGCSAASRAPVAEGAPAPSSQPASPTSTTTPSATPPPAPATFLDEGEITHHDVGGPMPESVSRLEWLAYSWFYDDPPPPLPDVVRTTTPDDAADVWIGCMEDSGFPITLYEDGGYGWEAPSPALAKDYDVAFYLCQAQYPPDPKYYQPWNVEQLEVLYAYQTGEVTDCLTELGYPPPPPPSQEKFISDYRNRVSPRWWVFDTVPEHDLSVFRQVELSCPIQPADLYDLATPPTE